jgi:hypothetical protein
MPRLQRPGANSDLIKNREDSDCTARHVQWRDGLIEQAMEIDELPENDERLLKKPEIKRDEMARFEQHGASNPAWRSQACKMRGKSKLTV